MDNREDIGDVCSKCILQHNANSSQKKTSQKANDNSSGQNCPKLDLIDPQSSPKYTDSEKEQLLPTNCINIDVLPNPVCMVRLLDGGKFSIMRCNTAYETAIGQQLHEIKGKPLEEWLPKRMASKLEHDFQHCVDIGKPYEYEDMVRFKDAIFWWKTKLAPIFDKDGKIEIIICSSINTTEEKLQSNNAAQKHADLVGAYSEFNQFYSTAAHDLRSPLCELDVILKLISIDFQDLRDGKYDLLEMAIDLVAKSLVHLDDVLKKHHRVQEGKQQDTRFCISKLCSDILALLDPRGEVLASYANIDILSDNTIVQILLRNLIDNAIKHNHGTSDFRITIEVTQPQPQLLCFTVEDNGKGFAPEARIIAENYVHAKGFGLSAAKRMTNSRGGNLWVEDSKVGAKVCFTIPGQILDKEDIDQDQDQDINQGQDQDRSNITAIG